MLPALLSERLRYLRADLSQCLNEEWSSARLAAAAQVPPLEMARLEQEGAGSAAALASVLRFYHTQGYNLQWLLVADNAAVDRYAFEEGWSGMNAAVFEEMRALQRTVTRRVHQVLEQLLPHSQGLCEADRRHYQRLMPPVRAVAAGWQSRGVNSLPCHYYASGEALPRCGDAAAYLTFDEAVPGAPSATRCRACAAHLPAGA